MYLRIAIIIIIGILLAGCGGRQPDARLERVAELAALYPDSALALLDSIPPASLGEADRHYRDLLTIRARDKAYITHTSDSLILDVIDYYADHRSATDRYPMALYYGGRVYADLGDYPTAIKYFQDALDITPIESDITLRGNILSQTGWLLNDLRLYNEAIPYLKEALKIDSIENDVFNMAYDNQLIGSIYLKSFNPDSAMRHFVRARELASTMTTKDVTTMDIYIAATFLQLQDVDSALMVIRGVPGATNDLYENLALINATEIYKKAGIIDTAYIYAKKLVQSNDGNNKKSGYYNLLSPELLPLSNPDSLPGYIRRYHRILDARFNAHESQLALMQRANYNYNLHVRERMKAEQKNKEIFIWWCIAVIVALVMLIIALAYKIRSKQTLIKLNNTLTKLTHLQQMIDEADKGNIPMPATTVSALRDRVTAKLEQIEKANSEIKVPEAILNSPTYAQLQNILWQKGCLPDGNDLWRKLFSMVDDCSPELMSRLEQLSGIHLKLHERQTITLIKCGLSLSQMAQILSKTKSAIRSRREALSIKIIGERVDLQLFDALIRQM